ncbi:Flp family type IVb pilin [Pseudomonas viridiflava]|uniref:Flp family type IVb pilin n=1 Tax=Pseudomonas viridiflava TaxID=33069 RepID=UPI002EC9161C|nr:Flp family type IVb pilin [Pseudomonas viridiflava]MEE3929906.1 Flp family type IVb pilin [Pseudomonas viridiflava]MEE3940339.1 Flp family type IVb pilin [Pseudomonas viridiflava]MEE3966143.1 Flp family type IVb pilin [Pseudomonas viridiflava]MEE3980427.1 Flp family type IVb pilin [Pseudomonas viridiflava]
MFLTALYVECHTRVSSFIKDREAASGIEYALLAAMVAVALVAFVPTISGKLSLMFTSIQNAL